MQTPVRPHTESTPVRIAAQKAAADEAAAEVRAAMAEIEAGERAVAESACTTQASRCRYRSFNLLAVLIQL